MAISHVKKCTLTIYNLCQTQGWLILFIMLVIQIKNDPYKAFYEARETLQTEIFIYQVLQGAQLLDVIFPMIGFTRGSVVNAFLQTGARSIFGFISLPMHREYLPIVLPILICFSAGEFARYQFNLIHTLGWSKTRLGRISGHMRWNAFLVLYPIGAFLDGLAGVFTIPVMKETEPMPYSISLPNKLNFAFNFAYFLTALPLAYVMQFPVNFGHLLRKRKQFYAELEFEDAKAKID